MRQTRNTTRMRVLLLVLLWTTIGGNTAMSQDRPLQHGKILLNGATYDIRIRDGHDDIYIYDDSLYDRTKPLISPEMGVKNIPEHFIYINTDKLLEIKRRFYGQDIRMDIRATITKEGGFMGLDYILPKSPLMTEQQFRTLDAEVRKHLKVSVVFPNEWVRNQKYNGYATKYVKLE